MSLVKLPKSSITDFPNEVLDKIFQELKNIDLANCSMVTKYWREHIHTKLGLNLKIGVIPLRQRHSYYYYPEIKDKNSFQNVKIQYISKYGSQFCWFGGVIHHNPKTVHKFKYWYLVKRLIFDGKLSFQTMNNILDPLANLANLTIGQFTLLHLHIKDVHLTFPKLQTLIISGQELQNSMGQMYWRWRRNSVQKDKVMWRQMIMNIVYLLKRTNSPSINEIVLQGLQVQSSMQTDVILEALWQFIVKHKYTLDKLSILFAQARFFVNSRLETPLDYEKLATEMVDLRLKSIFVKDTKYMSCTRRMQQLLGVMLQSQDSNSLKHLSWTFDPTKEVAAIQFPGKLGLSNQTSLVSIEMTLSRTLKRIYCKSFLNCRCLKMMTLISGARINHENVLIDIPRRLDLIQLDHLPPNLKSFRINGLDIEITEAHALTKLDLELLELKNIGCTGSLGLGPNSIVDILNKKAIKLIRLDCAVNTTTLDTVDGAVQLTINSMLNKFHYAELEVTLKLVDNVYESCRIMRYDWDRNSRGYEFHGDRKGSKYFKNIVPPSLFGIESRRFDVIPLDRTNNYRQHHDYEVNELVRNERIVQENLDYSDSDVETTSEASDDDEEETESDSSESKSEDERSDSDNDNGNTTDSFEVSEESSEEDATSNSEEDTNAASSEDADSDSH